MPRQPTSLVVPAAASPVMTKSFSQPPDEDEWRARNWHRNDTGRTLRAESTARHSRDGQDSRCRRTSPRRVIVPAFWRTRHDARLSVMKKRTGRNPVESSREQLHDERRCALLGVMWVARRCEGFRCGPRGGAWSASRMPGDEAGARCPSGPVHRGERQLQGYRLASRENDLPEPGRMPGHVTRKRGEHRWKPNGRRSVTSAWGRY